MKIYWFYILTALTLFLHSCGEEKENDWELDKHQEDLIIVEGMITNKNKGLYIDTIKTSNYVKLTRPVTSLDEEPENISGAEIKVFSDNETFTLKEHTAGYGIYISDTALFGISGNNYVLLINYQNRSYSSTSEMPPLLGHTFMGHTRCSEDSNLYQLTGNYFSEEPTMLQVDLEWPNTKEEGRKARLFYYRLDNFDINSQLKPNTEEINFPKGTKIEQRIYSLSKTHQEFLRSLLIETAWRGSVFDVIHGNVITNMSEGARGFWGASTVSIMDTVVH